MRFRNVTLERSDILGRRSVPPAEQIGKADIERWRRCLGYLSLFASAATVVASQATVVSAEETKTAIPPRIAAKAKELLKKLNSAECSKPALLSRQSEYRLPGQKAQFNMVELLAGTDACPGTPIPSGTYTSGAPYTDTGNTTGANNTVGTIPAACNGFYATVAGPDHIYSFQISARGANPQIRASTSSTTTHDLSIYILNGTTGAMCPAGTGNSVTNCVTGADDTVCNPTCPDEVIGSGKMNTLPLNTPLHFFVDSFYSAASGLGAGAYTIAMQDVTVAGGPTPPANDAPFDMNGDGKSDYVVVRNAGGPSGDLTWWTIFSGNEPIPGPSEEQALAAPEDGFPTSTTVWGTASDFPVPADYDGDGKDDFAVWRPGNPGVFYIVRSATATLFSEPFGVTGDDPTVVGDYTGDNRDDVAVYRSGATSSDPSTWFYRSLGSPPGVQSVSWGQGGDTPAPGDYDGDLKNDFAVQRPDSNGVSGRFWVLEADGLVYSQFFGLANDTVVTGDFDDDGKTDVAVVRNDNGSIRWDYEPSGTAGVTTVTDTWGVSSTDVVVPADYDGDGRTEYAVWRPGNPGFFHIMTPVARRMWSQSWGLTGDIAVANNNAH